MAQMDWIPKKSYRAVLGWLEATNQSRYTADRKLDFFATSMRDFDDVGPHLEALAQGKKPHHSDPRQRIVDLRGASLADKRRIALSDLGTVTLATWNRYGVNDALKQHELPRHLLLFIEAIKLQEHSYLDCLRYWNELSGSFEAKKLLEHWDKLFAINYLDTRHQGYAPGDDFRVSGHDIVALTIDFVAFVKKEDSGNRSALLGANKLRRAIEGKIPRGRHRVTSALAMELLLDSRDEARSLLDHIGIPERLNVWTPYSETTKDLILRILDDAQAAVDHVISNAIKGDNRPRMQGSGNEANDSKTKMLRAVERRLVDFALSDDFDFASSFITTRRRRAARAKKKTAQVSRKSTAQKRDYIGEAEENERVGKFGERFVVAYEQYKLKSRPDLAEKVKWVAENDDSAGFDVLSYGLDGKKLHIEVKTTVGPLESAFYISINELTTAERIGDSYRLYRVYDAVASPKIYSVKVPLADEIEFEPITFRAVLK